MYAHTNYMIEFVNVMHKTLLSFCVHVVPNLYFVSYQSHVQLGWYAVVLMQHVRASMNTIFVTDAITAVITATRKIAVSSQQQQYNNN